MKIKRNNKPALDEARIMERVRASGSLGVVARELAPALGYPYVALTRALGRMQHAGLVRAGWTPNKRAEGGDPLQLAVYTAVEEVEPALDGAIALQEAPEGGPTPLEASKRGSRRSA